MSFLTQKIYNSPIQMFSLRTLQYLLEINKVSSLFKIVNRLVKSKVIVKIERDKYVVSNYSGSEFALANFIYEPSYVSFESALSYYGILSQFPYEITSATLKQTRSKQFNNKLYGYYKIKKTLFWGYLKQNDYLIAEKEKALADQIYLASKGIKVVHFEEYNLSNIDKIKLKTFLSKYPKTRQFQKSLKTLSHFMKI